MERITGDLVSVLNAALKLATAAKNLIDSDTKSLSVRIYKLEDALIEYNDASAYMEKKNQLLNTPTTA